MIGKTKNLQLLKNYRGEIFHTELTVSFIVVNVIKINWSLIIYEFNFFQMHNYVNMQLVKISCDWTVTLSVTVVMIKVG